MERIIVIEIRPGVFAAVGRGQYQAHDPDLPGFVDMNRERAEEVAEALNAWLDSFELPQPEPEPEPEPPGTQEG